MKYLASVLLLDCIAGLFNVIMERNLNIPLPLKLNNLMRALKTCSFKAVT